MEKDDYLITNSQIKNIRDLYRGINDFNLEVLPAQN